ncbi:MAG: glutamine synthetase type III, partial [Bacilli bacterium]|nr:glutamine synthetase type III [Bacilli bacterium]
DGYDESWLEEAKRRGLSNYRSTPEALAHYLDEKNIKVFMENGILSKEECLSRYEIYLEKYYKTIRIEALTLLDMAKKDILPAMESYVKQLKESSALDRELGLNVKDAYESTTLHQLLLLSNAAFSDIEKLEAKLREPKGEDNLSLARFYCDEILPLMASIRASLDEAETITARGFWPIPTYRELLFGVD